MADKIFNLANRDLTHLELTEPKIEAKELILSGNPLQSLDYADQFPNLHSLFLDQLSFNQTLLDQLLDYKNLYIITAREAQLTNLYLRSATVSVLDISRSNVNQRFIQNLLLPNLEMIAFGQTHIPLNVFQIFRSLFLKSDRILHARNKIINFENVIYQMKTHKNGFQLKMKKTDDRKLVNFMVNVSLYRGISEFEIQRTKQFKANLSDLLNVRFQDLDFQTKDFKYRCDVVDWSAQYYKARQQTLLNGGYVDFIVLELVEAKVVLVYALNSTGQGLDFDVRERQIANQLNVIAEQIANPAKVVVQQKQYQNCSQYEFSEDNIQAFLPRDKTSIKTRDTSLVSQSTSAAKLAKKQSDAAPEKNGAKPKTVTQKKDSVEPISDVKDLESSDSVPQSIGQPKPTDRISVQYKQPEDTSVLTTFKIKFRPNFKAEFQPGVYPLTQDLKGSFCFTDSQVTVDECGNDTFEASFGFDDFSAGMLPFVMIQCDEDVKLIQLLTTPLSDSDELLSQKLQQIQQECLAVFDNGRSVHDVLISVDKQIVKVLDEDDLPLFGAPTSECAAFLPLENVMNPKVTMENGRNRFQKAVVYSSSLIFKTQKMFTLDQKNAQDRQEFIFEQAVESRVMQYEPEPSPSKVLLVRIGGRFAALVFDSKELRDKFFVDFSRLIGTNFYSDQLVMQGVENKLVNNYLKSLEMTQFSTHQIPDPQPTIIMDEAKVNQVGDKFSVEIAECNYGIVAAYIDLEYTVFPIYPNFVVPSHIFGMDLCIIGVGRDGIDVMEVCQELKAPLYQIDIQKGVILYTHLPNGSATSANISISKDLLTCKIDNGPTYKGVLNSITSNFLDRYLYLNFAEGQVVLFGEFAIIEAVDTIINP